MYIYTHIAWCFGLQHEINGICGSKKGSSSTSHINLSPIWVFTLGCINLGDVYRVEIYTMLTQHTSSLTIVTRTWDGPITFMHKITNDFCPIFQCRLLYSSNLTAKYHGKCFFIDLKVLIKLWEVSRNILCLCQILLPLSIFPIDKFKIPTEVLLSDHYYDIP